VAIKQLAEQGNIHAQMTLATKLVQNNRSADALGGIARPPTKAVSKPSIMSGTCCSSARVRLNRSTSRTQLHPGVKWTYRARPTCILVRAGTCPSRCNMAWGEAKPR